VKRIVALTGAGISADSGLGTFRDTGGLWEGYDIEDVASIGAWYRDKENVLNFYNMRRKQAADARPNPAHHALVSLEEKFDVTIVTQNVDDLHEKAGSGKVIHLHGMLRQARSEMNENLIIDIGAESIQLGDMAPDGSQLRPNIVWFGEAVPLIEKAYDLVTDADIFIIVGTSLVVYPAAGLVNFAAEEIPKYLVDPLVPGTYLGHSWQHIKKRAAEGLPELAELLLSED
jgi:NAD-dependent deacetylase